jgi:HlyD family secretion protein
MASARVDPLFRIGAGSNLDLAADVAAKQAARIAIGQKVTIKVTGIEDASGSIEPFLRLSIRRRKWGRCGLRLRTIRCCGRRFARAILNLGQTCGATVPLSALLFAPDRSVVQTA